jgi:hypothetical protein
MFPSSILGWVQNYKYYKGALGLQMVLMSLVESMRWDNHYTCFLI